MRFLSIVMKSVLGTSLFNRLVNRYTAHGIIIVVMQLESLGVLPSGTSQSVDGLPTNQIAIWLTVGVGIYFVFHAPKFKSKLERKKNELEILKTELDLMQVKKEIEQEKNSSATASVPTTNNVIANNFTINNSKIDSN